MKHILFLILLSSQIGFAQKAKPAPAKAPEYKYMIVAGEGEDFAKLETEAKAIAEKTGLKYNTRQMVYSAEKGKVVLPMNYADEAYQGEYLERISGDDEVSIEMKASYTKATEKMMVIVLAIYTDKAKADAKLKELKKNAPKAAILKI